MLRAVPNLVSPTPATVTYLSAAGANCGKVVRALGLTARARTPRGSPAASGSSLLELALGAARALEEDDLRYRPRFTFRKGI